MSLSLALALALQAKIPASLAALPSSPSSTAAGALRSEDASPAERFRDEELKAALWALDSGDEKTAIVRLEEFERENHGTRQGARALFRLGTYFRNREERDRAAVYFGKLVHDYPSDWPLTRQARSQLDTIDRYVFSPFFDRLKWRIETHVLAPLLGRASSSSYFIDPILAGLAAFVTRWVVQMGSLVICLLTAFVLALAIHPSTTYAGPLTRRWTLLGAAAFLSIVWTVTLCLQASSYMLSWTLVMKGFAWGGWFLQPGYLTSTLLLLAPLSVVLWQEPLARVFGLSRITFSRMIRATALTAGGFIVVLILVRLAQTWLVPDSHAAGPPLRWTPSPVGTDAPWRWVLPYFLAVAVSEECVFRGVLYKALRSRLTVPASVCISAVLFSLAHLDPFWLAVQHVGFGAVMAWTVERTGNLGVPVLLHWGWNLLVQEMVRLG